MSNKYIGDVLELQDLEKINYGQELKENAGDYSGYVNERVNQIVDESFSRKRASFQKAMIDMGRYMDMEHNASNFKTRSADVKRLQDVIEANNNTLKNASEQDINNSKRQFEINEYYYYNKLETLFFLQLFFIATLSMAILIHLQRIGVLGTNIAGLLILILLSVVAMTGVYRYYYTKRTRDTRLWHRRRFEDPEPSPAGPPIKCDKNGNIAVDLDAILPSGAAGCAMTVKDTAKAKFDKVNNQISNSIKDFQERANMPSENGDSGFSLSKCMGRE